MRRWMTLLAMTAILLAGCSFSQGPIDSNWGLALLPSTGKLAFFDPATQKVMREISLRQHFFMDYAIAPNGKVYIPLSHTPGHPQNYIGILDRQTGQFRKVPVPVKAVTMIQILGDGTAFIGSGSVTPQKEILTLLFDTNTDEILGTLPLPGTADLMTPLSEGEVLIPMDDRAHTGKVLLARRDIGDLGSLFLPVAMPYTMLLGPDGRLYVGYLNHKQPVAQISVVDPENGQIENVPTVTNPMSIQIHGHYLYAASETTPFLEIFRLPDLTRLGRIEFDTPPIVSSRRL